MTDNEKLAGSWILVWSDEFDGPAHSLPDPSKWGYDLGGKGWGNNELQGYTDNSENILLDGHGHLLIRATYAHGVYKSGRIKTLGLFEVQEGKIEACIKLPYGQGIWPAFWMLGNNIKEVGWPKCGEIDIMENIGKEPSVVHAAIHGPGYTGAEGINTQITLPDDARIAEDFHIFGVEWFADAIEFFLDGNSYARFTPQSLPVGSKWIFDHPFFILLNVAVGGNWPGDPDSTTIFPQVMTVDWVRVWKSSLKNAEK
jgi:beta-glucanase (GH16 family)